MPAAAPMDPEARRILLQGVVIPAHPLALNSHRKLDERRQRALTRYYCESGAGGLAVGVHTTQFAIRDPRIGLFDPVLKLAVETARECEQALGKRFLKIAGICGQTSQAIREAGLARQFGYDAGLLSLSALGSASIPKLIDHCREVAESLPLLDFTYSTRLAVASCNYNSGDSFWRWRTWWRLRWPPSTATTPLMSFAPWPRAAENPKSPFIPAMTTTSLAICSQTSVCGQRIAPSALISLGACWGIGPCGPSMRLNCWRKFGNVANIGS